LAKTDFVRDALMSIRARDITPINEAGTCLLELADEAVAGAGKVLTRNGSPYVAIVDARKLSYYHALEAEHDRLIMLGDAEWGLADALAGRVQPEEEFRKSLRRAG
jgi:hypothetical protein